MTRSHEAGGQKLNCVESRVQLNRIVRMVFLTMREVRFMSAPRQTAKQRFKAGRASLAYAGPPCSASPYRDGRGLPGSLFCTVWTWLFLRQRGDIGTGQVPHSSFLATGRAMALSLGQYKVKPQCPGNKGQRPRKTNVPCVLSHEECRFKNYTHESRKGWEREGDKKRYGKGLKISF